MRKSKPIGPMAKLLDWLEVKDRGIPLGDLFRPSRLPEGESIPLKPVPSGPLLDSAPQAQKINERSDTNSDNGRRKQNRDDLAILLRKTCKARQDAQLDLSTKAVIFSLCEHDHDAPILRAKPEALTLDGKEPIGPSAYWDLKPAVVYWFNTKKGTTQATTFKAIGSRICRIKRASSQR